MSIDPSLWEGVVQQIYQWLNAECALVDKYGLILASRIPEFRKDQLISPIIWRSFIEQEKLAKELGVKSVQSFVVETDIGNIIFSFGSFVHLITKVPLQINLAEFMPNVRRFMKTLDQTQVPKVDTKIEQMHFEQEIAALVKNQDDKRPDNFPIFKSLIKSIAKGR
jgi:predicted regulator of Ras-like GTPase activity (Roadblock/LC7/MglB family)